MNMFENLQTAQCQKLQFSNVNKTLIAFTSIIIRKIAETERDQQYEEDI